ncbi:MAG: Transglycosylase associated protein [Gemmatimonadetes bacterium]|nr:Transglycosylase associated protein [Gemmatimonadota bacterium]
MHFIGMIIFGLIVGAIAKLIMPGRDPGGFIVTILLGIAGSLVGGFLARSLGMGHGANDNTAGWIGSIIGALLLLFIYRMVVGRRHRTL